MEKRLKVEWTARAVLSLQGVYSFYSRKSIQAANNIISDIIEMAETITFPEQYQQDDSMPKYRRMIVRHYKILYRFENEIIYIADIFDTRQNTIKMK